MCGKKRDILRRRVPSRRGIDCTLWFVQWLQGRAIDAVKLEAGEFGIAGEKRGWREPFMF